MKIMYDDILSRIGEEPSWWDDNGTPRYGEFRPALAPNVYAKEVAFVLIACQACGTEFRVTHTWAPWTPTERGKWTKPLTERFPHLYYGDPPNAGCCHVGQTMSSDPIRVLEFWSRDSNEWVRRPEFEIEFKTNDS